MTSQDYFNWTVGTSAGVFVAIQTLAKLWPLLKTLYFRWCKFPANKRDVTYEIVQLKGKEGVLHILAGEELRWISSSLTMSDLRFTRTNIRTINENEWGKYSVGGEVYTRGQRGK